MLNLTLSISLQYGDNLLYEEKDLRFHKKGTKKKKKCEMRQIKRS